MKDLLLFVLAIVIYFSLAYMLNRIFQACFPPKSPGSSTVHGSILTVAGLMTVSSLVASVLLKKAPLGMPGVYMGFVLSMLLGGESHGPGDPYSWSLIAAPINFFFYYGIVRIIARYFPSVF